MRSAFSKDLPECLQCRYYRCFRKLRMMRSPQLSFMNRFSAFKTLHGQSNVNKTIMNNYSITHANLHWTNGSINANLHWNKICNDFPLVFPSCKFWSSNQASNLRPRTSKIFSAMDLNNDGNAAWVRVCAEKHGVELYNTNSCNFLRGKIWASPGKNGSEKMVEFNTNSCNFWEKNWGFPQNFSKSPSISFRKGGYFAPRFRVATTERIRFVFFFIVQKKEV